MAQTQLVEVGQIEGTTAFNFTCRTRLGDMAKGVGAHISELVGVGSCANTERVHHQNKGTFHGSSPCYKSARVIRRYTSGSASGRSPPIRTAACTMLAA